MDRPAPLHPGAVMRGPFPFVFIGRCTPRRDGSCPVGIVLIPVIDEDAHTVVKHRFADIVCQQGVGHDPPPRHLQENIPYLEIGGGRFLGQRLEQGAGQAGDAAVGQRLLGFAVYELELDADTRFQRLEDAVPAVAHEVEARGAHGDEFMQGDLIEGDSGRLDRVAARIDRRRRTTSA